MATRVNLILLGTSSTDVRWPIGNVQHCEATPSAVASAIDRESSPRPDAWLFWDSAIRLPNPVEIQQLLSTSIDVWHAGLRLGTAGQPTVVDYIAPMWMLNSDPDPRREATSWRLSLRASLIRDSVIQQLGIVSRSFESLDAAGLELGHRYIESGAMMRHLPQLVDESDRAPVQVCLFDELLFARSRFTPRWWRWAVLRMIASGSVGLLEGLAASRRARRAPICFRSRPLNRNQSVRTLPTGPLTVSVIVPTVDRYSYLRTLLSQLASQTVTPQQVIIVDQTAVGRRDQSIKSEFPGLPLSVIYQDDPGQCTSRNVAIQQSTGTYLLFVDDDDEIPPTLIEDHLRNIAQFQAAVSCGVAQEVGALPLPESFRHTRISDVFPTNNALLRRDALKQSGLFDLAYDRGQRADGDLGMRLYKSGALMVLQPSISVLHHHAPAGGLRAHKARTITYGSSRQKLAHRQVRSVTEIYMSHRYFSKQQLRESLWVNVLGTFSLNGSSLRRCIKVVVGAVCLPYTLWKLRQHAHQAGKMLCDYPQIPRLDAQPK